MMYAPNGIKNRQRRAMKPKGKRVEMDMILKIYKEPKTFLPNSSLLFLLTLLKKRNRVSYIAYTQGGRTDATNLSSDSSVVLSRGLATTPKFERWRPRVLWNIP